MNWRKRLTAALLSLAMVLSLFVQRPQEARAAGVEATGSIGLTVRFDLPQTRAAVEGRNVTLKLTQGGSRLELPLSTGAAVRNDFQAPVSVKAKNTGGVEMTTESRLGYYQAEVSGLRPGSYDLEVTGTGYVPYTASVTLDSYSRHVIIGTGDGTFSLGDVNGDGTLDEQDLTCLEARLGGAPEGCDLNGDGAVDVTDLAYVNYLLGESGLGQVLETGAITAPVVRTAGLIFPNGGAPEQLFTGTEAVTVAPAVAGSDLTIPIELTKPVEMEQVEITCPDGAGAIQTGTATVEAVDGSVFTVPFDISAPAGVHAIGPTVGERVVAIDLGRRVAVKKITIQVTRVAGQTGAKPEYATVTQIEFLKDIVPEDPKIDDQVMDLSAKAGDGMVELSWAPVRNVTGYEVAYGTSADALDQTLPVVTSRAAVTGLENQTTYYFQVTATNGSWRGRPSAVVSAMPEAAAAPGAPSNIRVEAADGALRVSWGKTKDATFYQLFYRVSGEGEFVRSGGDLSATSATIAGLTNGVTYDVAVKAGNSAGVGPYSAVAEGTPKREELTMPDLPTEDRIDAGEITSIKLSHPHHVDTSLCPDFQTGDIVDNDASTYWVARKWWETNSFTFIFAQPHDMNYVILVPYLQGLYRTSLGKYRVTAWNEDGELLLSETEYPAPRITEANYVALPFKELKGVKTLTISPRIWDGARAEASIAEIAFYNSDPLAEDIAALFTDGSFTALKTEVTQGTIAALKTRLEAKKDFYLELNLLRAELDQAEALLSGTVQGLVKNDFQSRSGSAEADRTAKQTASDLQPLGISAKAGATVAIYAQIPEGEAVSIVPTQYYGESGIWRGSAIRLQNGRNYITVPKIGSLTDERGGPLYVTYSGSRAADIKLHVLPDNKASFAIPVLELSDWYTMSEAERRDAIGAYVTELEAHVAVAQNVSNPTVNIRNATEISTPSVLLSLPADCILAGLKGVNKDASAMTETMYQNVLAWEEVLFVANKVQGIIDSNAVLDSTYRYPMTTRQNIRYMRMFAGAFMYAAGNHVGIGYGSASALAQGRPTSTENEMLFGWGIAHEIGHNMDKLGKAEITNNIYSLAVQAWDGGSMKKDTRLTISNIWPKIFDKVSVGRPGAAGNVFVQLGMYWQLHLAYDTADEPLKFFNDFFRAWKSGACSGFSGEDRFAVLAAQTANRDLTPFFARWGLVLSDAAKAEIEELPEEPHAIWYLDDSSWLNSASGTGTPEVTTAIKDSVVTLTVSNTDPSAAVQGYEVLRDGKAIGFALADENGVSRYEDDLGAANNRTYKYSVIAVDQQGNMGAAVPATPSEIRIAYDTAIDAGLYDAVTAGGAVTFTMKDGKEVPVTGIKIKGGDLLKEHAIQIGEKETQVTEAPSAEEGAKVYYFTKPGAEPGDTRIWTYDAKTVTVTGVSENASVTLLDYPGDRVDFYDAKNVTAGKLAEPFSYEDKEGNTQTIPAGTVVIMGTYRGDPVYTTIGIEARYDLSGEAVTEDEVEERPEKLSVERPMNGFTLLFAEIPEDQEVSDISDGIFMFVPDWDREQAQNKEDGWSSKDPQTDAETDRILYPTEIRAVLNRTDTPETADRYRTTSETLWISFPHAEALTNIKLTGN